LIGWKDATEGITERPRSQHFDHSHDRKDILDGPSESMFEVHHSMTRTFLRSAAVVLLIVSVAAADRKFYDDDPIAREADSQDASQVQPWDISLTYDSAVNLFGGAEVGRTTRALDINTIDEVPDSSWFVNRRMLTPEEMMRGVDADAGPAPGPWTVRSGKGNGVSPGFTIVDSRGQRYFVKFDPPGWPGLATGAEVVVTRLYHALGYYVPQTNVAFFHREDLMLDRAATTTGADGNKRPMRESDIDANLRRAARMPDGRYRALVSTLLPGARLLNGFKYLGTRPDDPNDVIPHEHRRSLRALRVFGAWVDHRDTKAINSMDALIVENGRGHVRHNLLDFGSTLGSGGVKPRDPRDSFEYIVDIPPTRRALPAFGFAPRPWMSVEYPAYERVGRFESAAFDPIEWKPRIPNAAFLNARADDLFWGARRLTMVMTDDMIRAAVRAARYEDAETDAVLARMLIERRDKIARAWLPAVNPVVDLALADSRLTFANSAVDAGVAAAPSSYIAVWSRFDNSTGTTRTIGETSGHSPMTAPAGLPSASGEFIQVDLRADRGSPKEWEQPVHAWFKRTGDSWKLVGFERLP
jgi:hypothetical protein